MPVYILEYDTFFIKFKLSVYLLALSNALAAASLTAVEVTVAPDTPSISALPAVLICSANSSKAAPPIASVSFGPSHFTSVTDFASVVIVTVTFPPKQSASPV